MSKTFAEQQQLLLPGEGVAPVGLVAAAMICIKQSSGSDPLNGGWVRCHERVHGRRVVLYWYDGRLGVDCDWDVIRYVSGWLASAGTSEPCPSSS